MSFLKVKLHLTIWLSYMSIIIFLSINRYFKIYKIDFKFRTITLLFYKIKLKISINKCYFLKSNSSVPCFAHSTKLFSPRRSWQSLILGLDRSTPQSASKAIRITLGLQEKLHILWRGNLRAWHLLEDIVSKIWSTKKENVQCTFSYRQCTTNVHFEKEKGLQIKLRLYLHPTPCYKMKLSCWEQNKVK